ncbi:alpha-galactosidase [Pseudoxanthomonas sp. GM95]|uniref:glycoside hydrolase family 27 protein n=1 Tax=Pseudoxanthomonas sp. GM95 TaxID=1881043 RepID=UPI0008C9A167|nr:glycoside hydrolase family 27 protein [Pseudoxanthomonas sp. GM95]SEL15391.1 alpha-galactosidase [Pseudoxanthomonas sp. GM95]
MARIGLVIPFHVVVKPVLLALVLGTAVAAFAGCAHAPPLAQQAAVTAEASSLEGVWVFAKGPSFPGPRYLRIAMRDGQPQGSLTTDWYGDVPMNRLRIEGTTASFEIDNGNAKLPARPWTATLHDGHLRVQGRIWDEQVDIVGLRGSEADAARLAFPAQALPVMQGLAPDGQAATPPMGWSSWNKFADRIDDATVRGIADAMVRSGLRDAGYLYINIDDGWQGARDASGVLQPNAHFPDMKALADYVHAKGLKLGIYSSPGPKTCAGYVGSYGHVEQDARAWAEWGIDYVKYDLCSGEGIFRTPLQVRQAYLKMGLALRATGRPILYSLCQYGRDHVGQWGRDVGGHLWRTTGDIEDRYAVMASIGFDRNGDAADAGPGGWNDPDMLEVGNGGMSQAEYRTHMTLWALSAAPLLLGNDVRTLDPVTRQLLLNRDVIAVDQDALGQQGRPVRSAGEMSLWRKAMADGSVVIGIFNRGEATQSFNVSSADISLPGTRWKARDLWSGRALKHGVETVSVPAHGASMIRLWAREGAVRGATH